MLRTLDKTNKGIKGSEKKQSSRKRLTSETSLMQIRRSRNNSSWSTIHL